MELSSDVIGASNAVRSRCLSSPRWRLSPFILLMAGAFGTIAARANTLTATVETLQIEAASNSGFVRLTGQPTFDGGGCTSYWARGALDDQTFMVYFWPALLSAKNKGVTVSVIASGCSNGFPVITLVQVNPS